MDRNTDNEMVSPLEAAIRKAERQDWVITDIFAKITESGESLTENQKIILIYWLLFPGCSPDFLSEMMRKEVGVYLEESTIRNYLYSPIIPALKNLIVETKPELSERSSINKQQLWFLLQEVFCSSTSLEEVKHRYWLLLGLAESLKPGSPLYASEKDPVAIDPPYIPTIQTQVTVTSNRHLREGPPLGVICINPPKRGISIFIAESY